MPIRGRVKEVREGYFKKFKLFKYTHLGTRFLQFSLLFFMAYFLILEFRFRPYFPLNVLITTISSTIILVLIFEFLFREFRVKENKEFYKYSIDIIDTELSAYGSKLGLYQGDNRDEKLWEKLSETQQGWIKNVLFYKQPIKSEFKLDQLLKEKEINKLALQAEFENLITNIPVVKIGKWLLLGFVILGLILWTGGTIYSDIKIKSISEIEKSVQDLSEDVLQKAGDLRNQLETAKPEIDKLKAKLDFEFKNTSDKITKNTIKIKQDLDSQLQKTDEELNSLQKELITKFKTASEQITKETNKLQENLKINIQSKDQEITKMLSDLSTSYEATSKQFDTNIKNMKNTLRGENEVINEDIKNLNINYNNDLETTKTEIIKKLDDVRAEFIEKDVKIRKKIDSLDTVIDDKLENVLSDSENKIANFVKKVEKNSELAVETLEKKETLYLKEFEDLVDKVRRDSTESISEINKQLGRVMQEQRTARNQISKAETSYSDIIKKYNDDHRNQIKNSLSELKEETRRAKGDISHEKSVALRVLDIDNFKEFEKFKKEIEILKESGEKLNLYNIRNFVSDSVLIIFGIIISILFLSITVNIISTVIIVKLKK